MANVLNDYFYGTNMADYISGIATCSLQFHITAKCDQACSIVTCTLPLSINLKLKMH